MKYSALAVVLLGLAPPLQASLWDDETLAADAKGLPNLVRVITGRFERNPPRYYEMRRTRAIAEIEANPNTLVAYDVAAVACDQLGRGDEAIAWMERKNFQMATMVHSGARTREDLLDHFYRDLANLATFWVHRWVRAGAQPSRIDELKTARDVLVKAVGLYPHTHFDREGYQLRMLERLIALPEYKAGRLPPLLDVQDPINRTVGALRALAGLIVLGDEWASVDLFNTLAQTLDHLKPGSPEALMARLRCHELIDGGLRSIVRGAPTEPKALGLAIDPLADPGVAGERPEDQAVHDAYRTLRHEAEAWQDARTAFMRQRLEEGRHPNTDPNFWNGYRDPAPPEAVAFPVIPTPGYGPLARSPVGILGITLAVLATVSLSTLLRWTFLGRTPRKARGRAVGGTARRRMA